MLALPSAASTSISDKVRGVLPLIFDGAELKLELWSVSLCPFFFLPRGTFSPRVSARSRRCFAFARLARSRRSLFCLDSVGSYILSK